MISNVLNTGIQGVQKGIQGAEKAATEIARFGQVPAGETAEAGQAAPSQDLAEPLVELKVYQTSVEANAKVVKVADEMIGTLLDIKA